MSDSTYIYYTRRVVHRVCGQGSPAPTENDRAILRVQTRWGGYPVTGSMEALQLWAERHGPQCPGQEKPEGGTS